MTHLNLPLGDWLGSEVKNKHQSSELKLAAMTHSYLNRPSSSACCKHHRICGLRGNMVRFTSCFTHCQCSAASLLISSSHKSGGFLSADVQPFPNMWIWSWCGGLGSTPIWSDLDPSGNDPREAFVCSALWIEAETQRGSSILLFDELEPRRLSLIILS